MWVAPRKPSYQDAEIPWPPILCLECLFIHSELTAMRTNTIWVRVGISWSPRSALSVLHLTGFVPYGCLVSCTVIRFSSRDIIAFPVLVRPDRALLVAYHYWRDGAHSMYTFPPSRHIATLLSTCILYPTPRILRAGLPFYHLCRRPL